MDGLTLLAGISFIFNKTEYSQKSRPFQGYIERPEIFGRSFCFTIVRYPPARQVLASHWSLFGLRLVLFWIIWMGYVEIRLGLAHTVPGKFLPYRLKIVSRFGLSRHHVGTTSIRG
jgi:hypothetical protein